MIIKKFKGILKNETLKNILNEKDIQKREYMPTLDSTLYVKGNSLFMATRKNAKYWNLFIIFGTD